MSGDSGIIDLVAGIFLFFWAPTGTNLNVVAMAGDVDGGEDCEVVVGGDLYAGLNLEYELLILADDGETLVGREGRPQQGHPSAGLLGQVVVVLLVDDREQPESAGEEDAAHDDVLGRLHLDLLGEGRLEGGLGLLDAGHDLLHVLQLPLGLLAVPLRLSPPVQPHRLLGHALLQAPLVPAGLTPVAGHPVHPAAAVPMAPVLRALLHRPPEEALNILSFDRSFK